tara:strand:+ start:319 stop:615 length:297 start_codon:yes stop_codon:yes gene_type:complete
MTIEITLRPDHLFDGETVSEAVENIANYYIEQDDYNREIISIEEHFDNGFSRAFYQSEIEKVQSDLETKLSEAEQEYYNQLEEEDWREQESVSYWENR